jgi:hypothetical protein
MHRSGDFAATPQPFSCQSSAALAFAATFKRPILATRKGGHAPSHANSYTYGWMAEDDGRRTSLTRLTVAHAALKGPCYFNRGGDSEETDD